jgi:NTE family protein
VYAFDDPVLQLDVRRLIGRLDAGIAFASWGELRVGVERGNVNVKQKIGDPLVTDPAGKYQLGGFSARFAIDTLDRRTFPGEGTYMLVKTYFAQTALGSDARYQLSSAEYQRTITQGTFNNWTFFVRGGSDFGSRAPYYDQFQQGGLFNFSGYQINELVGREYAIGAVQFRRAITLDATSGNATFIGTSLETGNVWQRLDGTTPHGVMLSGAVFIGMASKLGPIYLAYGHADHGVSALYLYLGSSLDFLHQ